MNFPLFWFKGTSTFLFLGLKFFLLTLMVERDFKIRWEMLPRVERTRERAVLLVEANFITQNHFQLNQSVLKNRKTD